MQQRAFENLYSNEYMIITLAGASLSLLAMAIILERDGLKKTVQRGFLYGMGAGVLNGLKNAVNLAMIALIPLSVLTPVKKGGGMVFALMVSLLIYKERYTKLKYTSIILSVIAIVLMQLA